MGRLPLHVALMNKASDSAILALLAAYPEAAKEKDRVRVPCSLRPDSSAAMDRLYAVSLTSHCSCAYVRSTCGWQDGRLPLYVALINKASDSAISALLAAYPEAVKEKDQVRVPCSLRPDSSAAMDRLCAVSHLSLLMCVRAIHVWMAEWNAATASCPQQQSLRLSDLGVTGCIP